MRKQHAIAAGISAFQRARLATAGALLIGAGFVAGCGEKKAATGGPPPALPVSVVQIEPTDVPLTGEWVGTMDGFVNAQIQPQIGRAHV